MIVTIHQPEHLPWLGFFNKMSKAEVFIVLDTVQYRKNYFQNRNKIMGTNGSQWLTVPVKTKGHMNSCIKTTEISYENNPNWDKKYFESIYYSYKKYPHFKEHIHFFEDLINKKHKFLYDFNMDIITYISNKLEFESKFIRASDLNAQGKSSDLILNICKSVNAKTYIAGPSGRDYLQINDFHENGIEVKYNDFIHPEYYQMNSKIFTPYLSTIDLMFNQDINNVREIIKNDR